MQSLQALKDQLTVGDPRIISETMYLMLTKLSQVSPATQLQSVALLMLLLADHFQVDRRKLLEVADSILADASRTDNEHIRALRMYMENEL